MEQKLNIFDLTLEIETILKDEFIATFTNMGDYIFMQFPNGDLYGVRVEFLKNRKQAPKKSTPIKTKD